MKKRVLLIGVIASVALAIGVVAALAGPWWVSSKVSFAEPNAVTPAATSSLITGVAIQNLSSSQANVVIEFYNQAGALVTSVSDVIAGNSQKSWVTPNITGLPSGFIGSAVVSSDQPVAANVNTQAPNSAGTAADPFRIGTSAGVASPTTKAYAPMVMKAYYGWNSAIYAQNTSGATVAITATIIGADGLVKDIVSANVPAFSMKDIVQASESALPAGFVGSAVVQSAAPIAVAVNYWNADADPSTAAFLAYNGIGAGGTKLYMPRLVRKYYDYNGGFKVQNIGTAQTRVRVTYYIGTSNGVTQEKTIQPNQAWGPYMGDDAQVPAGLASGSGSAVVESLDGQPIVAIVSEDNRVLGRGAAYNAILDGSQTTALSLAQVTSRFYGYSSGFQFQNVGNVAANGAITLTMTGVPPVVIPFSNVQPGQSFSFFAPNASGNTLKDFNGGAVIQTSNGQAIVGIGNQSFRFDVNPRFGDKLGDSYSMYNALNR